MHKLDIAPIIKITTSSNNATGAPMKDNKMNKKPVKKKGKLRKNHFDGRGLYDSSILDCSVLMNGTFSVWDCALLAFLRRSH